MMRPPLTTSMTVPLHGLAGLGRALDLAPGLLEAGALLGKQQPAVLVLLGEDQCVDLLADSTSSCGSTDLRIELVQRNDALALVADVDQDLVTNRFARRCRDDVTLLEGHDGRVVVGNYLAVDLEEQSVQASTVLGGE